MSLNPQQVAALAIEATRHRWPLFIPAEGPPSRSTVPVPTSLAVPAIQYKGAPWDVEHQEFEDMHGASAAPPFPYAFARAQRMLNARPSLELPYVLPNQLLQFDVAVVPVPSPVEDALSTHFGQKSNEDFLRGLLNTLSIAEACTFVSERNGDVCVNHVLSGSIPKFSTYPQRARSLNVFLVSQMPAAVRHQICTMDNAQGDSTALPPGFTSVEFSPSRRDSVLLVPSICFHRDRIGDLMRRACMTFDHFIAITHTDDWSAEDGYGYNERGMFYERSPLMHHKRYDANDRLLSLDERATREDERATLDIKMSNLAGKEFVDGARLLPNPLWNNVEDDTKSCRPFLEKYGIISKPDSTIPLVSKEADDQLVTWVDTYLYGKKLRTFDVRKRLTWQQSVLLGMLTASLNLASRMGLDPLMPMICHGIRVEYVFHSPTKGEMLSYVAANHDAKHIQVFSSQPRTINHEDVHIAAMQPLAITVHFDELTNSVRGSSNTFESHTQEWKYDWHIQPIYLVEEDVFFRARFEHPMGTTSWEKQAVLAVNKFYTFIPLCTNRIGRAFPSTKPTRKQLFQREYARRSNAAQVAAKKRFKP
jgi:hypothetical protein